MVKGWRDDIDTLLVFAGLFSAVVTAFAIESYQWLDEDPADTTVALLTQLILVQMHRPSASMFFGSSASSSASRLHSLVCCASSGYESTSEILQLERQAKLWHYV
ncbi:hypothetical protein MPER_00435, partial [Moniliophthora perniciosa FA553]